MAAMEEIWITAPVPPTMFYSGKDPDGEDLRQLCRRIDTVYSAGRCVDVMGNITYTRVDVTKDYECGEFFRQ